ncbi:MAG: patatin-like phospholipase family protein [Candidatus Omnitrophica bacterium]|nr:patatin-like phospholipase family protein [Candidatus Omnitrophota bacterium]MCM8808000.1 patatin-like phospholipase family protein [Candidatus Omnitrophota bacterium]
MKRGLALSGGGTRSFSQIGALKILEKRGFQFDIITGTSMGAIIGTIYSFTESAERVEEIIFKIFTKKIFRKIEKFFSRNDKRVFDRFFKNIKDFFLLFIDSYKSGLFDSEIIEKEIYKFIGKKIYFEEAKRKLGIVATEYFSGKTIIFHKGEIIPALIASCCIPGLIKPYKIKNKFFVDGGITSNLPVIANFLLGGEIIIGIGNNLFLQEKIPVNAFDVFTQIEKIKTIYLQLTEEFLADYVLNIQMPDIEWFNFSKIKECIKIGEEYTLKNLKFIETKLEKKEKIEIREKIVQNLKEYFLLGESSRI